MPAENPQSPSQISLQLLSCYSIPPPDAADCGLFKAREPFQKKCHYHIQLVCLSAHPSVQVIALIYCQILSSHLPDPSVYEHSILCRIEDIISKMITAAASAKKLRRHLITTPSINTLACGAPKWWMEAFSFCVPLAARVLQPPYILVRTSQWPPGLLAWRPTPE